MLNHIMECIQIEILKYLNFSDIFSIELLNKDFKKMIKDNDNYIWLDVFKNYKNPKIVHHKNFINFQWKQHTVSYNYFNRTYRDILLSVLRNYVEKK